MSVGLYASCSTLPAAVMQDLGMNCDLEIVTSSDKKKERRSVSVSLCVVVCVCVWLCVSVGLSVGCCALPAAVTQDLGTNGSLKVTTGSKNPPLPTSHSQKKISTGPSWDRGDI